MFIPKHHLYDAEKISFEINDTIRTIGGACKARLDLFKLPSVVGYDKILYLDTDIIVKNDINEVFSVCRDDILYVLEEGTITHVNTDDWWGRKLFSDDEIKSHSDKSAFTAGILLFNNCEKIKDLFDKINQNMITTYHSFFD